MATNGVDGLGSGEQGAEPLGQDLIPTYEQEVQNNAENFPARKCPNCRDFKCDGEDELKRHLSEECQERSILCPKKCQKQIKAKDLEKHIEGCMGLKKVDCPYKREGCDEQIRQGETEDHLKEKAGEHLELVKEDLIKRDRASADERDEIRNDIHGVKEEIRGDREMLGDINTQIGAIEESLEQNSCDIKIVYDMGQDIQSQLDTEKTETTVCKSYRPRVEGNETEIEKLKAHVAKLEQHLANLESQVVLALNKLNQNIHWQETAVQSVTTHKPQNRNVLVWSVDIAHARQTPGIIANSQRFYTGPKGYCISAKLYIGRGEIALRHHQEIMCIVVTVEHGDWDKMLKWPLSGFVSIELLNHNAPSDHYKPGSMIEFHQVEKPLKGKEGELATVQIPLNAIVQVPAKNCYLKNDIVHVRVMMNNNYKVPEWLL